MAEHGLLGFVRFDRFTVAGDHFVALGPFPSGALVVDFTFLRMRVDAGTAGSVAVEAALVGSNSLNVANIDSGLSLFDSNSVTGGVRRILLSVPVAAIGEKFVIPIGVKVTGSRRFIVVNVNLETVTLVDVLMAVGVDVT